MTYCKLLLCSALLLKFYFFAFSLNVFLSFNWLMMFHKWAILSAWVCYLTQLRVFSDALWIRCTVCIEYSPIYLNYLKPWTCVFIYDILLGPHFVTHVPWAGTSIIGHSLLEKITYRFSGESGVNQYWLTKSWNIDNAIQGQLSNSIICIQERAVEIIFLIFFTHLFYERFATCAISTCPDTKIVCEKRLNYGRQYESSRVDKRLKTFPSAWYKRCDTLNRYHQISRMVKGNVVIDDNASPIQCWHIAYANYHLFTTVPRQQ